MAPVSQLFDCQILWHRWQEPWIEHLHIREQPSGVLADGCIVGKVDNNLLRVVYQVHTDTTYQFQNIQLQMT